MSCSASSRSLSRRNGSADGRGAAPIGVELTRVGVHAEARRDVSDRSIRSLVQPTVGSEAFGRRCAAASALFGAPAAARTVDPAAPTMPPTYARRSASNHSTVAASSHGPARPHAVACHAVPRRRYRQLARFNPSRQRLNPRAERFASLTTCAASGARARRSTCSSGRRRSKRKAPTSPARRCSPQRCATRCTARQVGRGRGRHVAFDQEQVGRVRAGEPFDQR